MNLVTCLVRSPSRRSEFLPFQSTATNTPNGRKAEEVRNCLTVEDRPTVNSVWFVLLFSVITDSPRAAYAETFSSPGEFHPEAITEPCLRKIGRILLPGNCLRPGRSHGPPSTFRSAASSPEELDFVPIEFRQAVMFVRYCTDSRGCHSQSSLNVRAGVRSHKHHSPELQCLGISRSHLVLR